MSRTVELGRAVVHSPSAQLELWLTTLITVSPQPQPINLQQLGSHALIEFLSSGEAWVGRGNGMHIELDITLRGEPLSSSQRQELAESITKAPAWKQLELEPLLVSPVPDHGKLRINISHSRREVHPQAKRTHRIGANVPTADVRPPGGVPTLELQSVQFFMAITDTRTHAKATKQKQPKKGTQGTPSLHGADAAPDRDDDEEEDILFDEHADIMHTTSSREDTLPFSRQRSRQRPATVPCVATHLQSPISLARGGKRKRPATVANTPEAPASSQLQHIGTMVDAALRLSVCSSLGNRSNSLKIKANTFNQSLADVVPAIWRSGHLQALSQRAHLVPTLGLALTRVSVKAQTASLREKIAALYCSSQDDGGDLVQHQSADRLDENSDSATVASHLWIHTQKGLLAKPSSGAVQPFCSSAIMPSLADLEEIPLYPTQSEWDSFEFALDDVQAKVETRNGALLQHEFANGSSSHCKVSAGDDYSEEVLPEQANSEEDDGLLFDSSHPISGVITTEHDCWRAQTEQAHMEQDDDLLFLSSQLVSDPTDALMVSTSRRDSSHRCDSPKEDFAVECQRHLRIDKRHDRSDLEDDLLFSLDDVEVHSALSGSNWAHVGGMGSTGLDSSLIERTVPLAIV